MAMDGGYEYSYRFWSDEEIIGKYPRVVAITKRAGLKSFLFEIRTDFKLKAIDGATEKIGHERFAWVAYDNDEDGSTLQNGTSFRLKDDYWMSESEIGSLCGEALEFAKRRADEHAVVPVVVGLDVVTVQREGEQRSAFMDRAVSTKVRIPLYVWSMVIPEGSLGKWKDFPILHRKGFLQDLPRIRVRELSAIAASPACTVCSRDFIVDSQISSLPCDCAHAFHSRCVFDWLYEGHRDCPICKSPIPPGFLDFNIEDYYQVSMAWSQMQCRL